jgi:hypothetical protein
MLAKLITRVVIKDLTAVTVFRRGDEYFHSGAVTRLRAAKDKVTAKVEGTDTYRVELRKDDGALGYDCSCPHAADGNFCKHCVAADLAWLAGRTEGERPGGRSGRAKQRDPWRDIERFLAKQTPAAQSSCSVTRLGATTRSISGCCSRPTRCAAGAVSSRHSGARSTTLRRWTAFSVGAKRAFLPKESGRWPIRWRNCSSPTRPPSWWSSPSVPSSALRGRWNRWTTPVGRQVTSFSAWVN